MAFSRNFYDKDEIIYQNDQSTGPGRYTLNVPGIGSNSPYIEDPQIMLQKWGANLHTHPVQLESYLLGYSDKLNRDCIALQPTIPSTQLPNYPINNMVYVEEPRALLPAWELRGGTMSRENVLMFNPQAYVETPFTTNISTRIYERHVKKKNNCYPNQ